MGLKPRARTHGAMGLSEWMGLARRAKHRPLKLHFSLSDQDASGMSFPSDVKEFLGLAERRQLFELGDFTTLAFWWGKRFFVPGPKAAATVLADSFHEDVFFPLYLLCHFSGCVPLAYTGTSFYGWLLHIEGSRRGRTPVYEFSLHDAKCYPRFESLREVVHDSALRSGLSPEAANPKPWNPAVPTIDDPVKLWDRSLWLADALSNDLKKLGTLMKRTIGATDFHSELPLVAARPSLAMFWLGTHGLLANDERFARTARATARSKSALVQSFRAALLAWRDSGEKTGIANLDKAATAKIVAAVRDQVPRKLRKELAG